MTTQRDERDIPANRVLEQWKGDLWFERYEGGDFPREVLVTRYGDGSMQMCWRPNSWSTWSPPTDMSES